MNGKKQIEPGRYLRPALILMLAVLLVLLVGMVRQSGGSMSSATTGAGQSINPADVVRNNILTGYQFGILCRQENMRPDKQSRYHLCEAFYRQNFDRSAEAVIYLRAWFADQARLTRAAAQNDLLVSVAFLTLAVVMSACFVILSLWAPAMRLTVLSGAGFVLWAGVIAFSLYAAYDYSGRQKAQLTASSEMLALRDEADARALALAADGERTFSAALLDDFISRFTRISNQAVPDIVPRQHLSRN